MKSEKYLFTIADIEHVIDQAKRWSQSSPGDLEKLELIL